MNYVAVKWCGKAELREKTRNYFVLIPKEDAISFSCEYIKNINDWTASDSRDTSPCRSSYGAAQMAAQTRTSSCFWLSIQLS